MAEKDKQSGSPGAEDRDEVQEAMGEATGDTLKAPAGVENEPADKDLPEGSDDARE